MSLRWHLCGLHLTKLWPTLGSRDTALLATLTAQWNGRVEEAIEQGWFDKRSEAEEYRSSVCRVLERAILAGAPFPDLVGEEAAHFEAADTLARAGQSPYETDSWDWKHGAWFELHERLAPALAPPDRQLLDWLVHGRPIFGTKFATGWEFYTHLTGAEAAALRATLATALTSGDCPGPAGVRHFTPELIGWLDDITGRGLDVWVRAE